MMGNESASDINISLAAVWRSWYRFRQGKCKTLELDAFERSLEDNLYRLFLDLSGGTYRHGPYRRYIVTDSKRREISVAKIRDRVVHRLLYEYLVTLYDRTFIYDAWSCRKSKGLIGAINRTQSLLRTHPQSFVWRADIKKFFDSVDQVTLYKLLKRKIRSNKTLIILNAVIKSYNRDPACYERERERESNVPVGKGMPIGNLTSQIFANIYLGELDRFVSHVIKPQGYLRYGDDFIVLAPRLAPLQTYRCRIDNFLRRHLGLHINRNNDVCVAARHGLHFLGVQIYPRGRRLTKRNKMRIKKRLTLQNVSSYHGLVRQLGTKKDIKELEWRLLDCLFK